MVSMESWTTFCPSGIFFRSAGRMEISLGWYFLSRFFLGFAITNEWFGKKTQGFYRRRGRRRGDGLAEGAKHEVQKRNEPGMLRARGVTQRSNRDASLRCNRYAGA